MSAVLESQSLATHRLLLLCVFVCASGSWSSRLKRVGADAGLCEGQVHSALHQRPPEISSGCFCLCSKNGSPRRRAFYRCYLFWDWRKHRGYRTSDAGMGTILRLISLNDSGCLMFLVIWKQYLFYLLPSAGGCQKIQIPTEQITSWKIVTTHSHFIGSVNITLSLLKCNQMLDFIYQCSANVKIKPTL